MILLMSYANEPVDSKRKLIGDARNIQRKILASGNGTLVVQSANDWPAELFAADTTGLSKKDKAKIPAAVAPPTYAAYMQSGASKTDSKIHVVGHGNQAVVGIFNAGPFAALLSEGGLKTRKNIKKITLHSCFSGARHPNAAATAGPLQAIYAGQLAAALAGLLDGDHYVVVRGSDGESYTDSQGHNWAIQDGYSVEDVPKGRSAEHEAQTMAKFMKDRAVARPKFALSGGVAWQMD